MAQENSPARIGKTIVICGEVKGSEDLMWMAGSKAPSTWLRTG